MNKKEDIIDIYSFGIFLNSHLFTYKSILNNTNLFGSVFYIFMFNLMTKYVFQYSILNLVASKYWTKNFDNIAMPLLLNSIGNIVILNVYIPELPINRVIIEFISLLLFNTFLSNNYPNENNTSKMFRFNSAIFYFLVYNLL